MPFATFILSTGRCGTQWIARTFGDVYADRICTEHEPLHDRYRAREMLAHGLTGDPPSLSQPVLVHLQAIERQLEAAPYLECGHPSWSTIPWLADRLDGRARIIHLTRHPVPTAYSWATHGVFRPPVAPHLRQKVPLSPTDRGTRFPEFADRWGQLSPFEKCLFYWAEVNAFALEAEAELDLPWLRLKYEDLFGGDGLEQLLGFLELPARDRLFEHGAKRIDEFRYITDAWHDWRAAREHPAVVEVATRLGYELEHIDEGAMRARYLGS